MSRRVLGWALALAVTAVSVRADDDKKAAETKPAAPVLRPGKPADHGLKKDDLDALRALLKKAVDDETVPGVSLLVAHKGEVVFKEALGNLKADQGVRIASDTKPVVATVVAILADQGKLSLDDPLTKFVPEFKGTKVEKATLRQLLSHSAGVQNMTTRPSAATLAEYAILVAKKGDLREPGTFSYSGASIDLACRCAEKAGGQPFEALLEKLLLEPLGMKNTRFTFGGDPKKVPKEAAARGEGRYVSGGGGLSSTLDDLAAFYQMHLNGGSYGGKKVLGPKTAAEMRKKQVAARAGMDYGVGFFLPGPTKDGVSARFHHGGAFGTMGFADGDRELVMVLFTQAGLAKARPVIGAVQKKLDAAFPAGRKAVEEKKEEPKKKDEPKKEPVGKLLEKKFEDTTGAVKFDYLFYLPKDYGKGGKSSPLVLFLHGRGDKLARLKRAGLPRQVEAKGDFPFLLVAPQSPERGWAPRALNALLDDVAAKYKVDKDRIYVTGLSMGGFGTWSLAAAYPDKFAAIVPICGGGSPAAAKKIKDLPAWVFHGAKDKVVPPSRSEVMVKALKDAGAKEVKFTLYPDAGHDSWTETYKNPKVWEWLLKHKRGGTKG